MCELFIVRPAFPPFGIVAAHAHLVLRLRHDKDLQARPATAPPKPADYPIPLYNQNMRIPRPCNLLGKLAIGDTQLTMFGGDMKGVLKTVMETAHEKGADIVVLTSIRQPEFESAHFRVEANLLAYADVWETVPMSLTNFQAYLQKNQKTLDPMEGIWSDGSVDRIGIIRNKSKPGRDFIAFMLNVELVTWQPGYKKMDIARVDRPGAYSLKYYRDDFDMAKTTVQMDPNHNNSASS
ncbi:MAG: hypothetical protein WDN00_00055 [Limisphaerales bacterium]